MTTPMNRTPLLLMVLVTLLAAAGWLFSKEAIRELPPAAFIGSRFLLAALLLLPLAWLREPPPTRAQLVRASRLRHIARCQPAAVGHRHQPERCARQRRLYHERRHPDGPHWPPGEPFGPNPAATTGSPYPSPSRACCCSPVAPTGACRFRCSGFWRRPLPSVSSLPSIATLPNPSPPLGSPASSWR